MNTHKPDTRPSQKALTQQLCCFSAPEVAPREPRWDITSDRKRSQDSAGVTETHCVYTSKLFYYCTLLFRITAVGQHVCLKQTPLFLREKLHFKVFIPHPGASGLVAESSRVWINVPALLDTLCNTNTPRNGTGVMCCSNTVRPLRGGRVTRN